MTPDVALHANGTDITAAIRDRLLSLTVQDEAGVTSDQVTLKLDDRPLSGGRRAALPEIGTRLTVALGARATGLVETGTYIVDEITYSGPPETLTVRARHADMPGPFRTPATRSWDATTLGDIARTLAAGFGYTAVVSPALDAIAVDHADQTEESPMAFLNRLAEAHDGIVKPCAGRLVLAPKGTAKSVSGQPLPELRLRPRDLSTWSYTHAARKDPGQGAGQGDDGGTQAEHWDLGAAELRTETAGTEPRTAVRYTRATDTEAVATARATKAQGDRAKATFRATLPGNPTVAAEQKLVLEGIRPGIPAAWRIAKVTHTLDRSGFITRLEAELFTGT
ncbi:late control protein D [Roseospira marina]|uniref:Late control protein D n=1 Tax=Roseospira marina TaxID=140057 RepID=A0A5M6IGE8_9PROT|nr:contractile injection system protein, VgrG/Pvc8 family [Roseospira marina]KAA5606839.1 late control protein D [Roseospira marina]MBB4312999.1 hypothetical protein [Roseospira marina]MBB5086228.1 hypothetical protein [Roseospira marina]